VVAAYRKIGLRAVQERFLFYGGGGEGELTGCCGLSAVVLANGGTDDDDDAYQRLVDDLYDAPDTTIKEATGLSDIEVCGWIRGFDHRTMLTESQIRYTYPEREWEEYSRGYSCGWSSYKAVFEAGLTATPEANETDDEGEGND
jgi:hypothetical protein